MIVNTASVAAFDGQIGQAAYSASKGGVAVAHAHRRARPLGGRHPGAARSRPDSSTRRCSARLPEESRAELAQSVLFPKRLGVPDDFASLALEIVRNHYLNGEVIRMDAGIRMPPK